MTTLALAALGLGCSSGSPPTDAKKDTGTPDSGSADVSAADVPADLASSNVADGATGDRPAGDAPASNATDAPTLASQQERGRYLVQGVIGCGDCHTPRLPNGLPDPTKYLAGNPTLIPGPPGQFLGSRNLTNDATGLKNRTDDEIKDMFLNGKRPTATGQEALFPVMPYALFHNMSNADADAIVAYLRTVPAVANQIPHRGPVFDVPAPASYLNAALIPAPTDSTADKASALRGRYLAGQIGACIGCHTPPPAVMGPDPFDVTKFFAGGGDFSNPMLGLRSVSKNLTPDDATGLGTWTVAEIKTALKLGKAKDGSGICPPMSVYVGLTDEDATDIANYLKSLPPIVHQIDDVCVFPPLPPPDGGSDGAATDAGPDGGVDADAAGG